MTADEIRAIDIAYTDGVAHSINQVYILREIAAQLAELTSLIREWRDSTALQYPFKIGGDPE